MIWSLLLPCYLFRLNGSLTQTKERKAMKTKQLFFLFLIGLISCSLLTISAQAQQFGKRASFQDDDPFPVGNDSSLQDTDDPFPGGGDSPFEEEGGDPFPGGDSPFEEEGDDPFPGGRGTPFEDDTPFSDDTKPPFGDNDSADTQIPKLPVADGDRTVEDDLPERFGSEDVVDSQTQNVLINSRYAGWEGVTFGGKDRISEELRGSWLMVDNNGRFEGKVIPGAGADVSRMNVFLMNRGRLVKQTSLDFNGRFEFNNVRQGAYALIGWGDKGFFAFGVNILANNPRSREAISNKITVTAFQNRTTINTDWISYYAAQVTYRVYGRYPVGEGPDDPVKLYGFRGLVNYFPESIPATSVSSHRVQTTADGRLLGRIHQMNSISGRPVDVRTTKVLLLEGDDVVASTTCDNYGVFEFQEVPNGSYGVVAAGVDGVGLIGITVGGSDDEMNDQGEFVGDEEHPIDFTLVSSETMGWLNHYAGEVAYRRGLLAPRPPKPRDSLAGLGDGCANCQNQAGGCAKCREQYLLSTCRQRGLTFEQWQQYCQGQPLPGQFSFNDLGNGALIGKAAERIRRNTGRVENLFENAFYPEATTNQVLRDATQLDLQYRRAQQQGGFAPQGFAPQPGFAPQQGFAPQGFVPQQGSGTRGVLPQGSSSRVVPQLPTLAVPTAPPAPGPSLSGVAPGF